MGGACSAYEERRGVHRVLVGKSEGKNHLEGPGVDGRIILKRIFTTWAWGIGWINPYPADVENMMSS
jgi:hypothetical protein